LIWLKKLSIIVILLIALGIYFGNRHLNRQRFTDAGQKNALVTAQAWVATATYRNNPERYTEFRDSLLTASGISAEDLRDYLNKYQEEPEKYYYFTRMVKYYVDSLTSPLLEQSDIDLDSLEAAESENP